jgi:hypothetical protein
MFQPRLIYVLLILEKLLDKTIERSNNKAAKLKLNQIIKREEQYQNQPKCI